MPSRTPFNVLRDILYNIDLAREFVNGITLEVFAKDRRTLYAVTRCLEIISEASRRLPAELKARHPIYSGQKWLVPEVYIGMITKTWMSRLFGGLCKTGWSHYAPRQKLSL